MSIYDNSLIRTYFCVLAVILGAVFGSFLHCAAWRIAHGESFLAGHSHCPSCGHSLGVADLVPVLSWCFLGGKCRYCGDRISARYPLSELFFALVSVVCLLKGDLTVITLRNWIFFCCLFCLSLVDLEAYIIPDGCILISVIVWVLALPFSGMSWSEIGLHVLAGIGIAAAILLLSLAMDRILHRESMGGGDIKLFAAVGLYLGFSASLFSVILACLIGLLFALLRRILPGDRDALIPFGPSIAASAAVMLLFGGPLVEWYLQLLRAG